MIHWKHEDTRALQVSLIEHENNIVYALNTIGFVFEVFPGLRGEYSNIRDILQVTSTENDDPFGVLLIYDSAEKCRIRNERSGAYYFEEEPSKVRYFIRSLSRDGAVHLIKNTMDFVTTARLICLSLSVLIIVLLVLGSVS